MKKWSGGVMIMALAMILIFRYSLVGKQPQKQSTYNFFHYHPENDTLTKDSEFVMPSEVKVKTVPKQSAKLSKKPRLVNVKGLDQLFSSHNISQEGSKALLLWAYMRPLLSRSDALPETAQGVKEAAVAWKDLVVSIVEEEKASEFSYNNRPENKTCPFSVNTLDKLVFGEGVILQFPCGLVEDSSISMLGIPDGPSRSFQIELLGLTLSGDSKPPVILHYNVSLPGDNMTDEPFIVQNTWTMELGWGKEERCPAHSSANSLKGIFCSILFFQ